MGAKYLFFALLTLFLCQPATAQYIQDYGDVSSEQWEINSFEDDADAHSIILFDFGESYVDRDFEIIHKRHKRIKILDPEESNFTEVQLAVFDDNEIQRLRNLSAHTINRAPDGTVTKVEVEKDDIFTEDSGEFEVTSFTFPALEPGSIIEYEYEMIFGNPGAMPDWTFQHSSPILHSEYRVLTPDILEFRAYRYGLLSYENTTDDDEYMREMKSYANIARAISDYSFFRTVLKNAPAVRSEPYVTALINYKNHMKFQLAGYRDNNGYYTSYMNTWTEIAEELMDSKQFGESITTRRSLRKKAEAIVEGIDSDLYKAKALYDHVAENVQWNDRHSLFATDRADDILEDLSGNSTDKALLLISLLRSVDLEADPVLISTRSRGWVDWNYPTPYSFNHTLVLLQIDGNLMILDPLDEIIPFGMMNPSSINGSGLLVLDDNAQIVDISPDNLSSTRNTSLLTIDATGKLSANIRTDYYGYEAILHRKLAEEDEKVYLEENHLENAPGSTINSYSVENVDDADQPLIVKAKIENDRYATAAGDMIYINPFFKDRMSENPFSNPNRQYPVEFNFGRSKEYTTTINIPAGYEVVEMPENYSEQFSEKAGFSFISQVDQDIIQMRLGIMNNEMKVEKDRYEDLRNYYANLTEFFNQQIVLKKKETADVPASGAESNASGK